MAAKMVSRRELLTVYGIPYSFVHLCNLEKEGKFPPRMNVGNCKVAWKQSEVKRWVQQWLRNRARAERVLKHLIPKAKNPLRMRFDPSINADHGSDEVGKQFTATREHIRKIEKDALKRRKSPSRQRKLKSFLDD